MAKLPFIYVKDKSAFVDTRNPRPTLLSTEQFFTALAEFDDKYANSAARFEVMTDLMSMAVPTFAQVKESLKTAKKAKGINWTAIWEDLRPLIPLYKRTNNNGQSQIFFVSGDSEVSKIDYTDSDALVDALMHRKSTFAAIREYFNNDPELEQVREKMSLKPFLLKMLLDFLLVDERHLLDVEPMQISWDPQDYAYKKMNQDLLVPGPTPTWDEFVNRLDYPQVFMAWVWGIFEPTNNIRQVLWLKGAGNDGKSSIQKAIEGVIGKEYCYAMKPGDESQQWFQKNVFGKVMVNYADCRNVYLIDNNGIKQLTGGDTTSIEGKGENSFTGKIYSKLLVTSNYQPKINPELQAHMSRLIKIEVAPLDDKRKDSGFERRLQQEIYAFLHKCQQAFAEYISGGYDKLELPEELLEKMRVDCASETYLNVQDFVQDHIEFDPEELANPAELKKIGKDYFLLTKSLSSEQFKYHWSELENKLHLEGCSLLRHGPQDEAQQVMWRGFRIKKQSNRLKVI